MLAVSVQLQVVRFGNETRGDCLIRRNIRIWLLPSRAYNVAIAPKGFHEIAAREIPRQPHALCGDDFIVNEVQPNHSRASAVLEVTADRIADGATQLVEVVRPTQ